MVLLSKEKFTSRHRETIFGKNCTVDDIIQRFDTHNSGWVRIGNMDCNNNRTNIDNNNRTNIDYNNRTNTCNDYNN